MIDVDWPISALAALLQNLNHPTAVNTLEASECKPQICDNHPAKLDHPMDQLKKQLQEMENLGVISAHEKPSTLCHPIVIAPRKDSDELRIRMDFTHLNKFIQRESHTINAPFVAVTSIPPEDLKYFCKFESCPLTGFNTPFVRYVCNRATFGISEWYTCCMDIVFNGLRGICKIVDDVLV